MPIEAKVFPSFGVRSSDSKAETKSSDSSLLLGKICVALSDWQYESALLSCRRPTFLRQLISSPISKDFHPSSQTKNVYILHAF